MITTNEQDVYIGDIIVLIPKLTFSIGKVQRRLEVELSDRAWHNQRLVGHGTPMEACLR